MIVDATRKTPAAMVTESTPGMVQNTIAKVTEVIYTVAEERNKAPTSPMLDGVLIEPVLQSSGHTPRTHRWQTCRIRPIHERPPPKRMVSIEALIKRMAQFMMQHREKYMTNAYLKAYFIVKREPAE